MKKENFELFMGCPPDHFRRFFCVRFFISSICLAYFSNTAIFMRACYILFYA